jgi:hypothetical protein
MSPNDADRPAGPAHRQAAEAPVFPDRGFLRLAPAARKRGYGALGHLIGTMGEHLLIR